MSKNWIGAILTIVGAVILCPIASADTETEFSKDSWQTKYLWQMEDYPHLQTGFRDTINQNLEQTPVPATNEERYRWQLEQYEKLNKGFAEELAKNIEPNPVPATEDEIYKWQLQDYPGLEKTFHNELMRSLEYRNKPFNP